MPQSFNLMNNWTPVFKSKLLEAPGDNLSYMSKPVTAKTKSLNPNQGNTYHHITHTNSITVRLPDLRRPSHKAATQKRKGGRAGEKIYNTLLLNQFWSKTNSEESMRKFVNTCVFSFIIRLYTLYFDVLVSPITTVCNPNQK